VEKTAHEMLSERAQKIAEIESRSSEAKIAASSMALVQGPTNDTVPEWDASATQPDNAWAARRAMLTKDEVTDGSPGTQLTQVSSQERPPGGRRSVWLAAVAALLAFALGMGGWLLAKDPPHAATTTPAPHEAAPIGAVVPPPALTASPPPAPVVEVQEEEPPKPSASTLDAVLPAPAPRPAAKRTSPAPAPAPRRANCNPPYVVDENHIRHIKPQCL
jgi:hypothetical protein